MPDALGLDVDRSTLTAAVLASGDSGTPADLAPVDTVVEGDDASLVAAVRAATTARDDDAVVVLAVSASTDPERLAALRVALDEADLQRVRLANSAVAAAADRAGRAGWPTGATVAVVELRRAGTDVAMLRGMPDGSFAPIDSARRIAGVDEQAMDDAIMALVAAGVDGGLPERGHDGRTDAALTRLHAAARIARQRLADDDSTFVSVRLPGRATVVEVQREEFESAVADRVRSGIPDMVAAFGDADVAALVEILVVGSAAPAGLVAGLLADELGRDVVADDSVLAVVHGAARMASESIAVTEPVALPVLPVPDEPADEPINESADEPADESPDDSDDAEGTEPQPDLAPAAAPVLAGDPVHANVAPEQETARAPRRPRAAVLRYWPVIAAAAGLVLLGGAAAAVTLSPAPEAVNPFVGANGSTSNQVGGSTAPSSVFAGASSSPETGAGTPPKKRPAKQAPAAPGVNPGPGTVPAPADSPPSSDPSPADTGTPSPDPTTTDTGSPGPGDGSDPLSGILGDITGS